MLILLTILRKIQVQSIFIIIRKYDGIMAVGDGKLWDYVRCNHTECWFFFSYRSRCSYDIFFIIPGIDTSNRSRRFILFEWVVTRVEEKQKKTEKNRSGADSARVQKLGDACPWINSWTSSNWNKIAQPNENHSNSVDLNLVLNNMIRISISLLYQQATQTHTYIVPLCI